MRRKIERLAIIVCACLIGVFIGTASARQTSTTTQTKPFEVISVDGNQLVIRGPDGTKEYTVPEAFRFTVNGQQLSVHELKAGMKGTATVTTITTVKPVTVTEVKNGTVMKKVGNSVVVRGENGIKMYSEGDAAARGIKIIRDGKPVSIADLNEGDHLTATFITQKPPTVMTERQVNATTVASGGQAPASMAAAAKSGAAPAGAALGATPSAAPAAAGTSGAGAGTSGAGAGGGGGRRLPKTASSLPLVGFLGGALLAIGAGLTLLRRRAA